MPMQWLSASPCTIPAPPSTTVAFDDELQAKPTTDSGKSNDARTTKTDLGDMETSGAAQSNATASRRCCIKFSQQNCEPRTIARSSTCENLMHGKPERRWLDSVPCNQGAPG